MLNTACFVNLQHSSGTELDEQLSSGRLKNCTQETTRAASGTAERELSRTCQAVPGMQRTVFVWQRPPPLASFNQHLPGPLCRRPGSLNLGASTWKQVQSSWGWPGRLFLTLTPPRRECELFCSSPSLHEGNTLQGPLPRVGLTRLGTWGGCTPDSLRACKGTRGSLMAYSIKKMLRIIILSMISII